MKKAYIALLAVSILITFISFILMFLPTFYYSYSSSTMHISGYGTSTSKTGNGYVALYDSSVFLMVVCVLFTLASFPMFVLAIVFGALEKPRFMLFLFLGFIFSMIPGFSTFFAQFFLGSSTTNGVSGAWKSDATHFEFGAAGGWFIALKIISFITIVIAIVLGSKMKNEFYTYVPSSTRKATVSSSVTTPKLGVSFDIDDSVKLISPVYTHETGVISSGAKGVIKSKGSDGKYIVEVTLEDETKAEVSVWPSYLEKTLSSNAVSITKNDKEIEFDPDYDFEHLDQEAHYCGRCGKNSFVKYPTTMVCYHCRKVYSMQEYSELPIYHKEDSSKEWTIYPDVLNRYKEAVSDELSAKMKAEFGLDKNEYYDFLDKDYLQSEMASSILKTTDAEHLTVIFGNSFFLLIPKSLSYEHELLSDPYGSLKKYFHKFDSISRCQYVKTESSHLTEEDLNRINPKFGRNVVNENNDRVENHYNIYLKGIAMASYVRVVVYPALFNALTNANVTIDKDQDPAIKKFKEKYGLEWSEFQMNSIGTDFLIGSPRDTSTTHYCVFRIKGSDSFFVVTPSISDEGYKAATTKAIPDLTELEKYLFTPKDIYDVKYEVKSFSTTMHHSASMGDMILGDLAFGEAGMLAAAVANNYDTTSTSNYYHIYVTFKSDRLNGITLDFMDNKASGNPMWSYFLRYKDIASVRARNEVLKEVIDENKVKEKPAPQATISAADEIKKYKELLDCGAITQEEFDAKKKQLLDL